MINRYTALVEGLYAELVKVCLAEDVDELERDLEHFKSLAGVRNDHNETLQTRIIELEATERQTQKDFLRGVRTLQNAGYTDNGGALWTPPLGKSASPLLDRIDDLEKKNRQLFEALEMAVSVWTTAKQQGLKSDWVKIVAAIEANRGNDEGQ